MTALPGKPAANATPDNGSGVDKLLATSPGARLQRAREAAKLSVNDVADSLHLSPGVVKALEADDFRSLPNATFVKGYLRSYARLLGIQGEELVRTYESITGSNKPQPVTPIEVPRTGARFANTLKLGLLGIIIVVVAAWILWPSSETPVSPVESAQVAVPETVSDRDSELSEPQLEQVAIDSTEPSPDDELLDETSSDFTQADGSDPVPSDLPAADEVGEEPESVTPEPPAPVVEAVAEPTAPRDAETIQQSPAADLPKGEVAMNFTGDCWVEIRDGNGDLIYSNLRRNGETMSVSGVPPLEAKLGNGNVVSLSYNGQPVSFNVPPHNVVRVRLGE